MKKRNKDESLYVHQRDKLQGILNIRELNWTEKQKEFIKLALDKNTRVMFVSGCAGTSKTLISIYCALKLLNEKRVSELIYVRSAVESSDSKTGYLPGSIGDKMQFYNIPFMDKLQELLPKQEADNLLKQERAVAFPTNFARGLSWNAKAIVFDEVQNSSMKEIVTILTRFGHFSKCFVIADPSQTDLKNGNRGGFETLANHLSSYEGAAEHGVYHFKFGKEDIVRSEFLKFLVSALEAIHAPIA
jgi:phosphate starvation-inducible PhoH-like protein